MVKLTKFSVIHVREHMMKLKKLKNHCYEIHSILLKKEKVGQRRCIFVGETMLKTLQFSSS